MHFTLPESYKEIVMILMHLSLFYTFLTNTSQFLEKKGCCTLKVDIPAFVLLMFMMVLYGNGPN